MEDESRKTDWLGPIVRWTAKGWAIATIAVVILLSVGEGIHPAGLLEWIGLVLYPGGICAGMIVAFKREGLGGSITVGSLLAFYALHAATAGSLPRGWAWLVLAAPGFLFLWCWWRARTSTATAAESRGR